MLRLMIKTLPKRKEVISYMGSKRYINIESLLKKQGFSLKIRKSENEFKMLKRIMRRKKNDSVDTEVSDLDNFSNERF